MNKQPEIFSSAEIVKPILAKDKEFLNTFVTDNRQGNAAIAFTENTTIPRKNLPEESAIAPAAEISSTSVNRGASSGDRETESEMSQESPDTDSNAIAPPSHAIDREAIADEEPVLGLDRWWATIGDTDIPLTWTVEVSEQGEYTLEIEIEPIDRFALWNVNNNVTVSVESLTTGNSPVPDATFNSDGGATIGKLDPGTYQFTLNNFDAPTVTLVSDMNFQLVKNRSFFFDPTVAEIDALFIADSADSYKNRSYPIDVDNSVNTFKGAEALINYFSPLLKFDNGVNAEGGPERYRIPVDVENYLLPSGELKSWEALLQNQEGNTNVIKNGSSENVVNLEAFQDFAPISVVVDGSVVKAPTPIYASILENSQRDELVINYYFHYPRSNWAEHGGINSHQGDWEGIALFLERSEDGTVWQPDRVAFSQHDKFLDAFFFPESTDGGQIVPWENLTRTGNQPHVFVGLGGHASYPNSGITNWPNPDISAISNPQVPEYHRGNYTSIEPPVQYLPRVGSGPDSEDGNVPEWLLFPGKWGEQNEGETAILSFGNDGPPGPVFQEQGFEVGLRWLDPWLWSDEFDINETLEGHNIGETIAGTNNSDRLVGTVRDDTMMGMSGDDELKGGKGKDFVNGNAGNDTAYGGEGNDTVHGGKNDDILLGSAGDDWVIGDKNNDTAYGNQGNDTVYGGEGNDTVHGGKDDDTLEGGTGNDFVSGDLGSDRLTGSDPNDPNAGLSEIDTLSGGEGADTFVLGDATHVYYNDGDDADSGFSDRALISDFNPSEDILQLHGSAADYQLATAPTGLPAGTAIFRKTSNINKAIAIVKEIDSISLDGSYFRFV